MLASFPAQSLNQITTDLGIPRDSNYVGMALVSLLLLAHRGRDQRSGIAISNASSRICLPALMTRSVQSSATTVTPARIYASCMPVQGMQLEVTNAGCWASV